MQIKKLEISGFKSFMNPVGLDFGGGITAILGPNGCGKSNVVDSLRWVLGEQSAKQLRGEKMQNVVFGGTRNRKPLGMAEVSISFLNNQGRLPVAYDEVKLTRRLSRDGQSDYLLNGAPCRLKDIKDLITDTGAGSHAYSIIEREMVDSVISGHEDSRRFLFEEASGIMKYRLRRKEALRKLDMTEQDLLRLNDIIDEIGRTVRSLRRQMGRARRYQELNERLRRAETYLAQRRLMESVEEARSLQSQLESLRTDGVGDDVVEDGIGARIEVLRTELVDIEHEYRIAGAQRDALALDLKSCEETILVLRGRCESAQESRAAAEAEVVTTEERLSAVREERERLESQRSDFAARLETERESFRARKEDLAQLEQRHEQARTELLNVKQQSFDFAQDSAARRSELEILRARMQTQDERARDLRLDIEGEVERGDRLTAEHADLGARIEAVESSRAGRQVALGECARRADEAAAAIDELREARHECNGRLEATRSRRDLLRDMVEAHEGYGAGARALLERHGGDRVQGALAEHVVVPAGLEAAFDALLHDVLDALLVRDADAAIDLLLELRNERLGRATLVLPEGAGAGRRDDLAAHPGVIGWAADLLGDAGEAAPALARLLRGTLVVENAAAARDILAHDADASLRLATRDGLLFTAAGAVHGGAAAERDTSLLGRRQRLRELESEIAALELELRRMGDAAAELETQVQACKQERQQIEAGLRVDDQEHHVLCVNRASLETSIAEGSARRAQAGGLLHQLEAEIASLADRLPELTSVADRLSREGDAQSRALGEREQSFHALEQDRDRVRLEVHELRVAYVTLQGEAESHLRQLERLGELERELGNLCNRRRDEIARAGQDLERYGVELASAGERGADLASRLETQRAAQNEIGLRLDAQRGAIDTEQERLHEIEKARREHQGKRHTLELALSECTMRRRNLVDRMLELYGLDEAAVLGLVFTWTDEEPVPSDAIVRELREALASLGPVNLLALEEHEEKSTRLVFLEAQRDDLVRASTSLHETIDKINRTARFLFLETFEQVRIHFLETIRTVFDGGDGDLVLSNPEDPLDTDIEILVRPRGKKIDTLTQLSSGERALTAIALLFSIYLVKPSPFCVFDEVDAPLDDANIGRFVNLLQEFKDHTQFIVITHNKLTMEAADRLYGVTMEEEGVSKLVSVALDGELKGVPRSLKKKTQRLRAAAVLTPSEESIVGATAELDAEEPVRAAARLEPEEVLVGMGGNGDGTDAADAEPHQETRV